MATFVMQTLGCEVSAIHTVNFSNHTAYKQVKGRKSTSEEVAELYAGLRQSHLNDFDMMLSGYCPSASVVEEVGKIAREKRHASTTRPGSFFWVLDPVMGDNGKIYVNEDVVPAYKNLLKDADLILPNQFEAELLSNVQITDYPSLASAISTLHRTHRTPHIIITSVRLPATGSSTPASTSTRSTDPSRINPSMFAETSSSKISIIGSTARSDMTPRLFRLTVPAFPVFFSGTGDMFAALIVARLRQAAADADLLGQKSWISPDDVEPADLPLAKAAEKVLASMHAVLKKTMAANEAELEQIEVEKERPHRESGGEGEAMERHLRLTKAAEVKVVKNARDLVNPPNLEMFRAVSIEASSELDEGRKPDELGVLKTGTGGGEGGAVHQT